MKLSLFSLASALLLAASAQAAAQSCANPVFSNPSAWGNQGILDLSKLILAVSPVPAPSAPSVCKHFSKQAGATLSCCTSDTIKFVETVFSAAQTLIAAKQAVIAKNDWPTKMAAGMQTGIDQMCKYNPVAHCSPDLQAKMTSYIDQMSQSTKEIATASLQCSSGLLSYTEGMICFACETNWATFLKDSSKVIQLAQSTCDSMATACAPVFTANQKMLKASLDFASTIATMAGGYTPPSMGNTPDMCGGTVNAPGDCKAFVCTHMANGFGVPSFSWSPPTPPTLTATDPAGIHTFLVDTVLYHQALMRNELLEHTGAAADATAAVTGHGRRLATSHNAYVASGGYDAFAVGCADTGNCIGSGGLGAVAVFFIVLAVVGVVGAAVGMVVYRRRQAGARNRYLDQLLGQPQYAVVEQQA